MQEPERRMPERRMPERGTPRHNQKSKNSAQKMARSMSVFAFLACLIVIGVIIAYYQHKKNGGIEVETASTEVERLVAKDMDMGYPGTPAEVMKLFGRINQCMYNKELDDESFDKLLEQLRLMYSESLLEQNLFEDQRKNLKAEIEKFMSEEGKIANFTVDKGSSVKYKTINGQECAYVQLAFFLNHNNQYSKSFQNYVLVKENNQWKILAFYKGQGSQKKAEIKGES